MTIKNACTKAGKHTHANYRRLPAYGRDLVAMQRRGLNVPWLLISIGWQAGKALPRVVIADDQDVHGIDLTLVRGLDCMVTHHSEASRAFAVAALALKAGATRCPIFDMSIGRLEATTSEVMLARGEVPA